MTTMPADPIVGILTNILHHFEDSPNWTTCGVCGCLIQDTETCPSCRARLLGLTDA